MKVLLVEDNKADAVLLQNELALQRSSPWKHRLYTWLLKLYGDDAPRLQRHLDALRKLRERLRGRILKRGGR